MNEKKSFWKKLVHILKKLLMTTFIFVILFCLWGRVCTAPIVIIDKIDDLKQIREIINTNLIKEVDSYIKSYAPESMLSAEQLVGLCDMFQFDLKLAMSQAHIESHFGTKGRAVETNSVFNVGTYDNGRIMYTYNEPNESIEPYISLMKNYYLVDTINVDNLLYNKFVNYKGKRYSTSKLYEKKLIEIMDVISNQTDIDRLLSKRQECDSLIKALEPKKQINVEPQIYFAFNNIYRSIDLNTENY